jgi:hypothetical protein
LGDGRDRDPRDPRGSGAEIMEISGKISGKIKIGSLDQHFLRHVDMPKKWDVFSCFFYVFLRLFSIFGVAQVYGGDHHDLAHGGGSTF